MKYIALLRGINISGKSKIDMKELKKEIENIDFDEVITYLNSGNVIFKSNIEDKGIIANNIHLMIKNKFNLDIPIFIITMQELEAILEHSPEWLGKNDKEIYNNIIFVSISRLSCSRSSPRSSPHRSPGGHQLSWRGYPSCPHRQGGIPRIRRLPEYGRRTDPVHRHQLLQGLSLRRTPRSHSRSNQLPQALSRCLLRR